MKAIRYLSIIALVFISSYSIGQTKEKGKLDSKTFTIKLTETKGKRSGWQWIDDEIIFKSNKLNSKVMKSKEGFSPAPYNLNLDSASSDTSISFEATGKNAGGSEIKWNGTVTGDIIKGTAEWTNRQGKLVYSFSGTLK